MKKLSLIHFYFLYAVFTGCSVQSPRSSIYQKAFPFPSYEQNIGSRSYVYAPVDQGYIVTFKNDTLFGLVKLVYFPYGNHIPILPVGKNGASDVININRKEIRCIRTYPEKSQSKFNDYVNIGFYGLWRCLGIKNNVGLFDNYDDMGNGQKYDEKRMLLVTPNKKTLMYNSFQILFRSRFAYLRVFINKRYSQHFTKTYFTDEKAEINYILNRESEKL